MRSSFGARRQARKVGQEEDEEMEDARSGLGGHDKENTPTVIRPSITSRGSSKTKKRSSARVSFGPGGTSMTEDDDSGGPAVFTPKKSSLSRQAVEKNALRRTLANNLSSEHLPFRQTEERPSYSADHLNELKTSTPSTPKDLRSQSDIINNENGQTLDLASKFGSDLAFQDTSSAIPTDAEIREKKERRARLAKEQDFINLSDEDAQEQEDSDGEMSLLPYARQKASKKEETRLVRDDEDIAEGFDEFVSDGRIALGKKAEREQKKRHEAEMRDLINEAEGGNDSADSEDDDSETERHAAYEAAQTRKGMDGLRRDEQNTRPRRPRTPPRITPLPTLAGCLDKLRQRLAGMEYARMQKVRRLEEIKKEKEDIGIREEEIQRLLKETGERYEKLRQEAEVGVDSRPPDGLGPNGGLGSGEGTGSMARTNSDIANSSELLKMAWER